MEYSTPDLVAQSPLSQIAGHRRGHTTHDVSLRLIRSNHAIRKKRFYFRRQLCAQQIVGQSLVLEARRQTPSLLLPSACDDPYSVEFALQACFDEQRHFENLSAGV